VSSRRRDEPVRLTRIYTRGGDGGETSLGDGSRVSKLDPLVGAYGAVDEVNSLLGWVQVLAVDARLGRIQNELFDLGADLCVPFEEGDGKLRVVQAAVDRLEADCDEVNAGLTELRSFVLPGGTEVAARLHVARAVCRRAEREVLAAALERPVNPLAAVYLNRLSDLLFLLARAANADGAEPLWLPGGDR
jgi:cob(I)alamin adenosyltransferase